MKIERCCHAGSMLHFTYIIPFCVPAEGKNWSQKSAQNLFPLLILQGKKIPAFFRGNKERDKAEKILFSFSSVPWCNSLKRFGWPLSRWKKRWFISSRLRKKSSFPVINTRQTEKMNPEEWVSFSLVLGAGAALFHLELMSHLQWLLSKLGWTCSMQGLSCGIQENGTRAKIPHTGARPSLLLAHT